MLAVTANATAVAYSGRCELLMLGCGRRSASEAGEDGLPEWAEWFCACVELVRQCFASVGFEAQLRGDVIGCGLRVL